MKKVKILVVIGMLLIPAISFSQAKYHKPEHKEFMANMINIVKHNKCDEFIATQIETVKYNPKNYPESYDQVDTLFESIRYNPDEFAKKDFEKEYEEYINN